METRKFITRRDYKIIVFAIIHIILFLVFKTVFQKNITEIENLAGGYDFSKIKSIETEFGMIYAISSLIIAYQLFIDIRRNIGNLSLSVVLSVFLIFNVSNAYAQNSDISIPIDFKLSFGNFSYYLLSFIPYCYLIFKYSIVGIKEDITSELKINEEKILANNVGDLNKLLELELLTKDEHNKKIEKLKKEKIITDLKETEEYSLLLKSKSIGLFNEQEFNDKVKFLVEKRLKELHTP